MQLLRLVFKRSSSLIKVIWIKARFKIPKDLFLILNFHYEKSKVSATKILALLVLVGGKHSISTTCIVEKEHRFETFPSKWHFIRVLRYFRSQPPK